jgi:hypothetical protein
VGVGLCCVGVFVWFVVFVVGCGFVCFGWFVLVCVCGVVVVGVVVFCWFVVVF